MNLTPDQLARIERNKQEALAKLERNRLLRLEQQHQQPQPTPAQPTLPTPQFAQKSQPPSNQQTPQQQQQNNANQNKKQDNRDHYKQATLEEKQIHARVAYKTHQRTGPPKNDPKDLWTEKKKKDELMQDTDELEFAKQWMDGVANGNDAAMVVVNMDPPDLSKPKTSAYQSNPVKQHQNSTPSTASRSDSFGTTPSYDEWNGLYSMIGQMNKAKAEEESNWVKKPPPKEEEGEMSEPDKSPGISRHNSGTMTPPLSRNSSQDNGISSNPASTPPLKRNNSGGDSGNKSPSVSRNNSGDDIANNGNSGKAKQNIKNYFITPSPVTKSSPATSPPTTPLPPTPKSSKTTPTSTPKSSPALDSTTTPSPNSKQSPHATSTNKPFKKATPTTPTSPNHTPSKTVQQKINFMSVTMNAKAKNDGDNVPHHRIPDTIMKQGYSMLDSQEKKRAIMAPCEGITKGKKGGRSWVCWCVVYGNGCTSFRKTASTPAKRKKAAQTVPAKAEPLGVCFLRASPSESPCLFVLPLTDRATRQDNMDFLVQFIEAEEVCKVCYNTQDALKIAMEEYPLIAPKGCIDPQIGAWVCNPESTRYLFPDMVRFFVEKLSQFEKHPQSGLMTSHELMAIDQYDCLTLMDYLLGILESDKLIPPLQDEMDLIPVLSKMEMQGIGFNTNVLEPCKEAITEKMDTIKTEAESLINYSINFNSPQNVAHVLFDFLKLKVPQDKYSGKKFANTRKGNRSTSENILKKLESQHKLPSMILEYRHCQKLLSNWVDSLIGQTKVDQDGNLRIHAHWLSNSTSTGRLSSTDPNLQNIPKSKMTMGNITFHVRDSFCACEGWVLIGADYSQIELRVLAHITRDPTLNSFFGEGVDVLKMVASHWMGKPVDEISATDRDYTKRIVYGILYGIGAPSLASMLKVSIGEASKFMSTFLGKFPLVQQFIENTQNSAKRDKYVRTITGRLRRLPNINSGGQQGQQALRQAVNTVIQGTAADVVKAAMISVHETLKKKEHLFASVKLLLQIHDELVYEVKEDAASEFLELMQTCMVSSLSLSVPLTLSVKTGKSWGSMEAVNATANDDNLVDEENLAEEFENEFRGEEEEEAEDEEENSV